MSQTDTAVNERLAALTAAGTSVWLDQISRRLIESGELASMVQEYSLRGMTSNPAIFEKAILGAEEYDDQIAEMTAQGADARAIYRAIAIRDVQDAADVLRPVFDESGGTDGFVSLEVDPDLAHDSEKTIDQAREYWHAVDRPNLMIKIPGTDAGIGPIEQAITDGINVNVTLLFSVEAYARVTEAYIRGLEARHAAGKSLDVQSVASFFVSRVDTEVDKRLKALGRDDLAGRAGLANARAAYQRYKEIFLGERFAVLREAGAPVQRPLWASTGTKNPAYPDTLYVDNLVAPNTVNTMPMATLQAAADHTEVIAASADMDPSADLQALADAGVDMDDVTDQLLREGIAAFVTPMDALLEGIESKREGLATGRPATIESTLNTDAEQAIMARGVAAVEQDIVRRIWAHDDTVFGDAGQPEVADRLGWLTIADRLTEDVDDLLAFAQEVRADGITDVVLLGMGGSSLAPEVLRRSFGPQEGHPTLHVLDSTDAQAVAAVQGATDPATTLYVVSTKSGGTIETLSAFEHFHAGQPDGRHFVAITDPGSPLVALAEEHGFRRTFLNDPEIGGRYSALSYFGLVPGALMGADIKALLHGAGVAAAGCAPHTSTAENSGLWLGICIGELAHRGKDKLTFVIDAPLQAFGLWIEQLIAESTGKHGRGVLPVADEPLGAAEAYGEDRVFVHVRNADEPDEANAKAVTELARAGHSLVTVNSSGGADDLGRIFFFAEFATAVAGWVLGINPFDQPNVQEAKDRTKAALAERTPPQPDATDHELQLLLGGAAPPSYVAIMGYVPPSDAFDEAIAELRALIRDTTTATTTFGYGPRFLHSTGQLHKGGPGTGRFLQLVHHAPQDVPIEGADHGFETLKAAQAIGDLQTLRSHSLPAERVTLADDDPVAAVRALNERVRKILAGR